MTEHGLPEPAMQLWRDYGELLARELDPLGRRSWQLGGGTVLAKEWRHRRSFDLDITVATNTEPLRVRAAMAAIRDECRNRGLEVDDDVPNRLLRVKTGVSDSYGNESGIDLWVHDPGIAGPAGMTRIGNTEITLLSQAQILHGKLQRSNQGLTRDAYDIAYAGTRNGRALETAVNSLDSNHQQRAEMAYGTRSRLMELEGGQILDWNGNPAQDQRGCGIRASHAIHDARWTGLEIRSHEGRIFAETANTAGETRAWLGEDGTAVSEAVSRLDAAGILSHLQNQYAGQSCNLSEVIRRIAESAGRSETIVHTDPGPRGGAAVRGSVFTGETGPEPPRIGGPRNAEIVVRGEGNEAGGATRALRRDNTGRYRTQQ